MSLTSASFFIFILIGMIIYYLIPRRFQWIVLLGLSAVFYLSSGVTSIIFITFSIVTVWVAGRILKKISSVASAKIKEGKETLSLNDKKLIRKKAASSKKTVMAITLILNFGILFVSKYYNFLVDGACNIWGDSLGAYRLSSLIVPLGLSFYTFQSAAYLLDIYWDKIEPEENIARYALFISFFPQLIQGPIGRYSHLSKQLNSEHEFDYNSVKSALILMLWGYFKKLVLANRLAPLVDEVFDNPGSHTGIIVIVAVLAYSVQQYCDFSGGIDVIMGVAELFGIKLTENFKRPYFSRSLAEFWRRWHISLGAWMRDYVFYPLAMTKFVDKISKFCAKKFSERSYVIAQMTICNIAVFLLVGIWHGPEMHYVIWGLYNGIVIAIGAIMEPVITNFREKRGIKDNSLGFIIVSILWTFLIVNFGWFFDRSSTVSGAFTLIKSVLTNFGLSDFGLSSLSGLGLNIKDYCKVAYGVILLFGVSLTEEIKGISVREKIVSSKRWIQWPIIYILIFTFAAFAVSTEGTTAFMYAQF